MGSDLDDLRLEEVELSEDEKTWPVTWGYDVPIKRKSALDEMMESLNSPSSFKREYKLFAVNASTGQVESMKIRQVRMAFWQGFSRNAGSPFAIDRRV